MIKKLIFIGFSILLLIQVSPVLGTILKYDFNNRTQLQRGAKLYINYCSGCHSLKYMRYNVMAEDLGLMGKNDENDEFNLIQHLIFTQATESDPILNAMLPEDARQWFGVVPPDLSLTAKARGKVWLSAYLKSFYNDDSKPFGVNNLLVPNVAMPNVLEPLVGQMALISDKKTHLSTLLLVKEGQMLPLQADKAVDDLVTFLVYVSDPTQLIRFRMGILVIVFLCFLFLAAYMLNKSYWQQLKDKKSIK